MVTGPGNGLYDEEEFGYERNASGAFRLTSIWDFAEELYFSPVDYLLLGALCEVLR